MPLSHLKDVPLTSAQWRAAWDRSILDDKHSLGLAWFRHLLWDGGDNRAPIGDQFVAPQVEANLEWLLTILPVVDPHGWLADISDEGVVTLAEREILYLLLASGSRKINAPLRQLRTLFTTPPSQRGRALATLCDRTTGEMVFTVCDDIPKVRQMLNVIAWDVCTAASADAKSRFEALRLCLTSGINHRYGEAASPLLGALQKIHHRAHIQVDAVPDDILVRNPDMLALSILVFAEDWTIPDWDTPFCPMNYIGWCNAQSKGVAWDGRTTKTHRFSTLLREYARPNGTPAELVSNLFTNGQVQVALARIIGQSPQDLLRQLSQAGTQVIPPSVDLPQLSY